MNANYRRLLTRFEPETRFDVRPVVVPFRVEEENSLERLKNQLLREHLNHVRDAGHNSMIRRAANEAVALAWLNPYPLLVFPVLFEEKIEMALNYAAHQQVVRSRSRELTAA